MLLPNPWSLLLFWHRLTCLHALNDGGPGFLPDVTMLVPEVPGYFQRWPLAGSKAVGTSTSDAPSVLLQVEVEPLILRLLPNLDYGVFLLGIPAGIC